MFLSSVMSDETSERGQTDAFAGRYVRALPVVVKKPV
jgi:hypothetical protein